MGPVCLSCVWENLPSSSKQVITEAERNLTAKIPDALPLFRLPVERAFRVVPDLAPEEVISHAGLAAPKALPIPVAALQAKCPWLVPFTGRHYQPGHPDVRVMRPGEFIRRVREVLAQLD